MRKPASPSTPPDPSGEFPFEPATYFFHLAVALTRHRDERLSKLLEPLGYDLVSLRALMAVHFFQTCTMGELADYTVTDRTTLTRIVDHLVRDELVVRATPSTDRRKVVLSVTAQGRRLQHRARVLVAKDSAELTAGLDAEHVRAAVRFQREVAARLIPSPDLLERILMPEATNRQPGARRPASPAAASQSRPSRPRRTNGMHNIPE
jgi:DNA-binding MarR family transcriptional regulator